MAEFQTTLERYEVPSAPAAGGKRKRSDSDADAAPTRNEEAFSDDFSRAAFGADTVLVSTTLGLPGDGDGSDDDGGEGAGAAAEEAALRALAAGAPKPRPQVAGPKLRKPRAALGKKAAKYRAKLDGKSGKKDKQGGGKRRRGGPGGTPRE